MQVMQVPKQGTKIPHATGQLSPSATTTEPASSRAHALQQEKPTPQTEKAYVPQRNLKKKKKKSQARKEGSWCQ